MKFPLDLRPQDEPIYARGWNDAAIEIAQLRALLSEWLRDYGDNEDSDSQLMVEKTRRALESKP